MYYIRRIIKVIYFSLLRIFWAVRIPNARRRCNIPTLQSETEALETLERLGYRSELPNIDHVIAGIKNAELDPNIDISVIIPVYNGAKYLKRLCDSLLGQKTKYSYEMIFVDDGSRDDSLAVLTEYALNDERIKVFSKKNGGISDARNYGLDRAVGRYILLIDNDDYLESSFFETVLDAAKQHHADIVKTAHCEFDPNGHRRPIIASGAASVMGYMGESLIKYNGYVWGTLYDRTVWEKVRFPLGAWYEDMITRLVLFRLGRGFAYIDKPLYNYYVHAGNASKILWSDKSPKALDQLFLTMWFVKYTQALGMAVDEWTYHVILEELGVYLYSRTRSLDERMLIAAFAAACGFVECVRPNDFVPNKLEAAIDESFTSKNYKLYKAACAYADSYRRLK